MRSIGITGGVGAGKSEVLAYIKTHYNCLVILADEVAHELEKPGQECYNELTALLGRGILAPDGTIDRQRMAAEIFADRAVLDQVNEIVHPAVKAFIIQKIRAEKESAEYDFLFVEAALLIEGGYEEILDELWYIHTDADIRRERLKASRAYSDEKIDQILQRQLSEEAFRAHCRVIIDNSSDFMSACKQIDMKLEEYLCQR
ncbi:MAG: dephospho-CoA kinase [Lachnospiraceae bacterium]|nr:dephospho-CoA kinase [Lachnospiraceae bacterium]